MYIIPIKIYNNSVHYCFYSPNVIFSEIEFQKGKSNFGYNYMNLWCSAVFIFQLLHPHMTTGKTIALTRWTFVSKVIMSLHSNMLSRLVIAFLPKSKHLSISWLQSRFAMNLEAKKIKSVTVSTFSPSACHGVMRPDAMILVFQMLSFKPAFSLSSFTFIKRLFSSS